METNDRLDKLWTHAIDKRGSFVLMDDDGEQFPIIGEDGRPKIAVADDQVLAEKALGAYPGGAWPLEFAKAMLFEKAKKALEAYDGLFDVLPASDWVRYCKALENTNGEHDWESLPPEIKRFENAAVWFRDPDTLQQHNVASVIPASHNGKDYYEVWTWDSSCNETLLGYYDPETLVFRVDYQEEESK